MLYSQDDKAKLEAARALIKQKNYDLAARILRTMDHPTAKEWLEEVQAAQIRKRQRERPLRLIIIILLIVIVTLIGVGVIFQGGAPLRPVAVLPTEVLLPTSTPTRTPTATFTPSVTPTPTDTYTPSATSTFTPSATDTSTSTYTPSMTITFTLTPGPTRTLDASATPATVHATDPTLYYVNTGEASLYACPRVDCAEVAKLSRNDAVMVIGDIEGQALVGNKVWYSAFFGDKPGYINSSLVDVKQDITATPSQAFPTLPPPATQEAGSGS